MGRPLGSTTTLQVKDFMTYDQIREFVNWIVENYKTNTTLAVKLADKLFSAPPQSVDFNASGKINHVLTFRVRNILPPAASQATGDNKRSTPLLGDSNG